MVIKMYISVTCVIRLNLMVKICMIVLLINKTGTNLIGRT